MRARLIAALLLFGFPWFSHHSVAGRPAVVIKQVLTNKKVIALTFDDGPTLRWTPKILQVLNDNHVRATFFVIGSHAMNRTVVLKDEVDAKMEIGSHGFQHLIFRNKNPQTIKQEVEQNEALLMSLGVPKPRLYRLPAGWSDPTALKVLGQMGYKVVGWSIDTRDWRRRDSAEKMAAHVERQVTPGSIIIFHDGPNSSEATVNAVKQIVPALKAQGWKFDTASELLKLGRYRHPRS